MRKVLSRKQTEKFSCSPANFFPLHPLTLLFHAPKVLPDGVSGAFLKFFSNLHQTHPDIPRQFIALKSEMR